MPVCFTLERENEPQKKQFDIVRTMVGSLTLKPYYDNSAHQVPWCADAYAFFAFLKRLKLYTSPSQLVLVHQVNTFEGV